MEFVEEFSIEERFKIENEFSRTKDFHYLDNAGTALYAENQIKEITNLLTTNLFCNPHSSRPTENIVDQVRFRILQHFNADPDEYSVIFTSGATAALKIVGESFKFSSNDAFYYLTDSHTSVLGMREIVQTDKVVPVTKKKLLDETVFGSGLVVFPAQCNFNGFKYPLKLIPKFQENSQTFVCLDAASFVSTNHLDLQQHKPDFVCISFYKIFGYPTGLGALIVSKRGGEKLEKKYYGGGTVKIALTRTNWHEKRDSISERFEDGTISFLSIIALETCFQFLESFLGDDFIFRISRHVFNLAKYLYKNLETLKHFNGQQVVTFHHDSNFKDASSQGGIVNFSLRHSDRSFVGFSEFASIAALHNILLRTGCFCNPGACQSHLNLSNDDLMKQYNAGHVCGDDNDLVDGEPTGSIRVSFGYMNTKKNVDKLIEVIRECYLEEHPLQNEQIRETKQQPTRPRLKSIRIYPIKSCGSMAINGAWSLTNKGLKFDREWMIINGRNGTSLTQKNETRMCLIKPFIDVEKKILRLEFPDVRSIEIPLENHDGESREAKICETKVCGDRIQGIDCGNEIAQWLSDALCIDDLRLIKQSEEVERKTGSIALSNQAQFLLISEPSVKWLMNQIDELEYDVENIVNRFRGNFIIDNLDPFLENEIRKISIGNINFEVQGPCTRCQMICIDQQTGEKTTEPLRTIGRIFKGKMRFGIYLKHSNGASLAIKCDDELSINKQDLET